MALGRLGLHASNIRRAYRLMCSADRRNRFRGTRARRAILTAATIHDLAQNSVRQNIVLGACLDGHMVHLEVVGDRGAVRRK